MTLSMILLRLATLGWGVLCGAMIYEHLAIVPQWARNPPESLFMWAGSYALKPQRFWMGIHPLLLVLLGSSLAFHWDGPARDGLSVVLAGYALVLVVTGVWFVPELLRLTQDPNASIPPGEWRARSRRWERLSIARGALIVGLAWPLLDALAFSSS